MRPRVHCYLGKLVWDQNRGGCLEDWLFLLNHILGQTFPSANPSRGLEVLISLISGLVPTFWLRLCHQGPPCIILNPPSIMFQV